MKATSLQAYETMKPKNQHQQVLWYLLNWDNFTLRNVINDSMFYKFQTRLSEIERDCFKEIAKRKRKKFINRFGNKGYHTIYSAIDKEIIIELFNKYASKKIDINEIEVSVEEIIKYPC